MAQPQFSLAWEEHKRNICNGLSSLQQNGEFVDMTLAADGHFVKVHQIIVALASPYLKELMSTAPCPHPVIFLNKISYKTLCSVLEYIYTGEVLVSIDNLNELIDAGRELHIKGLEDMKLHQQLQKPQSCYQNSQASNMEDLDEEICYFEISNQKSDDERSQLEYQNTILSHNEDVKDTMESSIADTLEGTFDDEGLIEEEVYHDYPMTPSTDINPKSKGAIIYFSLSHNEDVKDTMESSIADTLEGTFDDEGLIEEEVYHDYPMTPSTDINPKSKGAASSTLMQYTVSNQGSLQMILNRFVYYLKYTNRNSTRQWRCVDYVSNVKCPAHVITKNDVVLQRISAHTHPFHDKKILKKVKAGAIFTAITEAVKEGGKRKKTESKDDSEWFVPIDEDVENSMLKT